MMNSGNRKVLMVAKIHISKTPNVVAEMDFPDYVNRGGFSPSARYLFAGPSDYIYGKKGKAAPTADKMVDAVLTHWVGFFGTPNISIADKAPRFTGRKYYNFVEAEAPLYRL